MPAQNMTVHTMMPVHDRADFVILAVTMDLIDTMRTRTKSKSRRDTLLTVMQDKAIELAAGYEGSLPIELADRFDKTLRDLQNATREIVAASQAPDPEPPKAPRPPRVIKPTKEINMNEKIEAMQATLEAMKVDVAKFEAGNMAAGTRVRVGMQSIKASAQEVRNAVTEQKNAE